MGQYTVARRGGIGLISPPPSIAPVPPSHRAGRGCFLSVNRMKLKKSTHADFVALLDSLPYTDYQVSEAMGLNPRYIYRIRSKGVGYRHVYYLALKALIADQEAISADE